MKGKESKVRFKDEIWTTDVTMNFCLLLLTSLPNKTQQISFFTLK